ncbi:MAG: hypothetical protein H0U44_00665, partial [Flavisolibacter sp.]|nr:hypothetical protein [Flavisolibacter sp.]
MKSLLLLINLFVILTQASAQIKTGANPSTIGNGQLLELEKSGQRAGLKLAEVALTSATDLTTVNIASGAIGTMLWNTGTGGVSPAGIYIWTGSAWVQAKTDNLYNANGTLTGNRTIALGTNTIAFTSTTGSGTSHFTIDGSTFNVDANNNRIGIGTNAPTNNLEINGSGGSGTGLKMATGAASGKVLTSDASGNASWQTGSVVVYSEIHGSSGSGITYNADAKLT